MWGSSHRPVRGGGHVEGSPQAVRRLVRGGGHVGGSMSMFANYVNGRYIKNSKSRNMTMVEFLKWLSHDSVYVNVIRKSNNSANNSSNGIPTKYRFGPCLLVDELVSLWAPTI